MRHEQLITEMIEERKRAVGAVNALTTAIQALTGDEKVATNTSEPKKPGQKGYVMSAAHKRAILKGKAKKKAERERAAVTVNNSEGKSGDDLSDEFIEPHYEPLITEAVK